MKQSVLRGSDIFLKLSEHLNKAKSEIIVVTAWFTDNELLDILVKKKQEGLAVSIIIGDNKDNNKLDFKEFEDSGGFIKRVKGKGYGILHQKYCIIDKTVVFHGSYNWTINARKNNSESVIQTNHKNTINELLNDFKKLAMNDNKAENNKSLENNSTKNWLKKIFPKSKTELDNSNIANKPSSIETSLDEVFKSIISAEIKKTNREEIKEMAYNQAQEVSGDSQVISKSMDSLYHLFVSDKKENNKNKEKLFKKIDDKVSEFNQNIITDRDVKLNSVKIANQADEKKIELQKSELEGKKSAKETKKSNILETIIPNKEKQIASQKEKISELDIEFVKPMFKMHLFIPLIILFIGLSIAMVLFYSSSAYIMLYSYDDALTAISQGVTVNPQVYEAQTFSKAIEKGGSAIMYILFFVFIPFTIAYIAHDNGIINSNKKSFNFRKYGSYLIVIVIDTFIALKVSSTIGEINYLTKGIKFERSFDDINFWLVFFLGAIPFFFLAEVMYRLINFFSERSAQVGREKMLQEKKIIKEKINVLQSEINSYLEKSNDVKLEIDQIDSEISKLKQSQIYLPKELDLATSQINQESNNNIASVRKKADVYKNDIENDNIQISLSSLKDRVSAFIEGWNEWLHDEYSIEKATGKSKEAIQESDQWLTDNMKKIEA